MFPFLPCDHCLILASEAYKFIANDYNHVMDARMLQSYREKRNKLLGYPRIFH